MNTFSYPLPQTFYLSAQYLSPLTLNSSFIFLAFSRMLWILVTQTRLKQMVWHGPHTLRLRTYGKFYEQNVLVCPVKLVWSLASWVKNFKKHSWSLLFISLLILPFVLQKVILGGISKSTCSRSAQYFFEPVTPQLMCPVCLTIKDIRVMKMAA